jgi:hypothetical protein
MQTLPLLQEGRKTGDLEVYAFPMLDADGNGSEQWNTD